ncbi:MAG: PorV/PorQ family protein [Bacteroidales bacterium]|nr:PorV/PorQ family protein [Bacteroidales bacterium]
MKKYKFISVLTIFILVPLFMFAGNEDRVGEAGASELLINPFPRSAGWGLANMSQVSGFEAVYLNPAGIAFTNKIDVAFANTQWLKGSGVTVNAFGFSAKIGKQKNSVLALGVMTMSFGDIMITTVDKPEGGIGYYTPNFLNVTASFAHSFSSSIHIDASVKIVNEAIADLNATGVAIDAGIQYIPSSNENIRLGIALRNIGPALRFSGDGFSFRGNVFGSDMTMTLEHRSEKFELPTQLLISAGYIFHLQEDVEDHLLSIGGSFISNAFSRDQFALGLEYNFKNIFMVRGSYCYEKGITSTDDRATAYTGPAFGATVQAPLNKEKSSFLGFEYSYRISDPFQGTHQIGVKLML